MYIKIIQKSSQKINGQKLKNLILRTVSDADAQPLGELHEGVAQPLPTVAQMKKKNNTTQVRRR